MAAPTGGRRSPCAASGECGGGKGGEMRKEGDEGGDVVRRGGAAILVGEGVRRKGGQRGGGPDAAAVHVVTDPSQQRFVARRHLWAVSARRRRTLSPRAHASGAVVANGPTRTQSGHTPNRHQHCGVACRDSPPPVSDPHSEVGQKMGRGIALFAMRHSANRQAGHGTKRGPEATTGGCLRPERSRQCPCRLPRKSVGRMLTRGDTGDRGSACADKDEGNADAAAVVTVLSISGFIHSSYP